MTVDWHCLKIAAIAGIQRTAMPHVISMMLIAFSMTQAGKNVEHSHG